MIGRHSPNMAVDELRQRFGSALRGDHIFAKYPELERRPRRLKLLRSRDVDHLTPREWKGELTAQSCDIQKCWIAGVEALKLHGINIDFKALFLPEDSDLMRSKGGKYPGLSTAVDRSISDAAAAEPQSDPTDTSDKPLDAKNILAFDGAATLAREEIAIRAVESETDGVHSIWIQLDDEGHVAHKKAVLRTFMDPTLDIDNAKSKDRLLRIRYFSIGGDHWDRAATKLYANSDADHLLKLGGLFATLICFETSRVSLAILQCTGIKLMNQPSDVS